MKQQTNELSIPSIRSIFDVSAEFLGEFRTWLEQNPASVPLTSVIGYKAPANSYALVRRVATQSLSAGVAAAVSFDTEDADGLKAFDAGTPTHLTFADTGFFLLFAYVAASGMSGSGNTQAVLEQFDSSNVSKGVLASSINGGINAGVVISSAVLASLGDYVKLTVTNNATGAAGSVTARLAAVKTI